MPKQVRYLKFTVISIAEKLKTSEKADKSELNDLSNPSEVSRFIHGPRFPKQNCSVLDEVLTADICTPGRVNHGFEGLMNIILKLI